MKGYERGPDIFKAFDPNVLLMLKGMKINVMSEA